MRTIKFLRSLCIGIYEKIVAILVVVLFCACAYYALGAAHAYLLIKEPKLDVRQPEYEQFSQRIKAEAAALDAGDSEKPRGAIKSVVDGERAEYSDILDQIDKDIRDFAEKTGQPRPTPKLIDNVFEKSRNVRNFIPLRQNLEALHLQLTALSSQAEALTKLSRIDYEYYTYTDFLDFYFQSINEKITKQRQRYREQEEFNKVQSGKLENDLKYAVILFVFFCGCTLLFVIISIEKNTRMMMLRVSLIENREGEVKE